VLKSPQHLEQFPALYDTFPDATFVVTHRDPVSVTASMVTMLAYGARMTRDHVDVATIGQYWAARLETMLRRCVDERDALPGDRSIDVRFDEFMADDIATVQQIYGVADQPFSSDVRAAMRAFMRDHPRGRHGGVVYDLAGDFDLDPAALRAGLRDYVARFRVAEERP